MIRKIVYFCVFCCFQLIFSQSEKITLPALSTQIDSASESVISDALPNLITIPANLPIQSIQEIKQPENAKKTEIENPIQTESPKINPSNINISGLLGAGYKNFFTGSFRIFQEKSVFPFEIRFLHETANGYAIQNASAGFFDSTTLLNGKQTYDLNESARLQIGAGYQIQANGLQEQSLYFYNTNLQKAETQITLDYTLPHQFLIQAQIDFEYLNRFLGAPKKTDGFVFSSNQTVFSPALLIQRQTDFAAVYFNSTYSLFYSTLLEQTVFHRGNFALGTVFNFFHITAGAEVSLIVSKINPIIPFALFVRAPFSFVQIDVKGGLRSGQTNLYNLIHYMPFAGFGVPVEQTDWFATAHFKIPVSPANTVQIEAQADFAKTAFNNGILLPNYYALNAATGLFALDVFDRTLFNTTVSAALQYSFFSAKIGVSSQWLYKNLLYNNQKIDSKFAVHFPKDSGFAALQADFPLDGDITPILGILAEYNINSVISLAVELDDMIKLFSANGRMLVSPYIGRSGGAVIKAKITF